MSLTKDMQMLNETLSEIEGGMGLGADRMDELDKRIESVDRRLTEIYEYTIARWRDHRERIDGLEQDKDDICRSSSQAAEEYEHLKDRVACLEKQMGYKRLDIEDLEMRVSALEPVDPMEPDPTDDPNYVFGFEPLNRDGIHFLTEGALERVKREARDELAREIVERVKGGYWPSIGFISYERRSAIAEDIRREYRGGED